MISVQEIVDQRRALLDDEGSQRYLFDEDHKPAINHAIDSIVSAINSLFAENKLSPENLRELNYTRVWSTNHFGRVFLEGALLGVAIEHKIWTILGVYPEPTLTGTPGTNPANPRADQSTYRPTLAVAELPYAAKRLTQEQWTDGRRNAFVKGNNHFANTALKSFAYLDESNYTANNYQPGGAGGYEITVRPVPTAPQRLVAISYLAVPNRVQTINDTLQFPATMLHMIVQMSLRYTAFKQGDGSTLIGLSTQETMQLISMMN